MPVIDSKRCAAIASRRPGHLHRGEDGPNVTGMAKHE